MPRTLTDCSGWNCEREIVDGKTTSDLYPGSWAATIVSISTAVIATSNTDEIERKNERINDGLCMAQ